MPAIGASLLTALSQAALSVIARLISKELFEELLVKLVVKGAEHLASKTESKTDDEFVRAIANRLNVTSVVYPDAKK